MVGYSRTKSLTLLGGVLAALLGAPLVPVLTAEDDLAHADGLRGCLLYTSDAADE